MKPPEQLHADLQKQPFNQVYSETRRFIKKKPAEKAQLVLLKKQKKETNFRLLNLRKKQLQRTIWK